MTITHRYAQDSKSSKLLCMLTCGTYGYIMCYEKKTVIIILYIYSIQTFSLNKLIRNNN